MPDESVNAAPVQVDTQSAPNTTQLQPPAQTPDPAPQLTDQAAAPHQSWFTTMAHSVAGAVLGTVASRDKEISAPVVGSDGTMQPAMTTRATTGDQLRQIARSALIGLAAGSRVPPQKSGFASAAAGLGAGGEAAMADQQDHEDRERRQASDDYERQQQNMLRKAQNAHITLETIKLRNDVANQTLESGQKVAALGQDALSAAAAGGNKVVAQDVHMDDLLKFRQEHPEYLNYTPVLSKVLPKEGAEPDPKTGEIPTDRYYSLIDMTQPVKMTPQMISHLKTVGFPGAENLEAGQEINPKQFQGLWYQGLKMYNEANADPKNKVIEEVSDAQGNTTKVMVNRFTNTVTKLTDPDTGKPLGGKVQTTIRDIYDPKSQQTGQWVINEKNGKKIAYVGPSKADMTAPVGDYSLNGDAFIQTLPPPMQDTVKAIATYNIAPEALGRSQDRKNYVDAAVHYDPTFDEKKYKQRFDFMRKWQSGQFGNGRLNTALGHLDMLDKAGNALAQNDLPAMNAIANQVGVQTGADAKVVFDTIARKAAGEAAGAIKGGASAATEPEIESVYANFNSKASPKQRHGTIGANIGLLKTQIETLDNMYQQAMEKTPESGGHPVVYPQNQPILAKWGMASGSHSEQPATPPGVPKDASHIYKDGSGNVVGYALGGKYVPIAAGK